MKSHLYLSNLIVQNNEEITLKTKELLEKTKLSWLYTPPSGSINPPVQTRVQELPFGDLRWEDFEKLCYRLVHLEADIEHCQLYGERGDKQQGIDIFARTIDSEKYRVYQCKKEQPFGPAKISSAIKKFTQGEWLIKSDVFILCTQESLRSTKRSAELEKQAKVLKSYNVSLLAWDREELSIRLKSHPELVDDFFGREWVKAFCGENVAKQLGERLDAVQLKELRSQLFSFYQRIFNIHDRGIPLPAVLPLSERYIIPDIEDLQIISPTPSSKLTDPATSDRTDSPSEFSSEAQTARQTQYEQGRRYYIQRIPFQNWIVRGRRSLVFGDPGSGKSTLLRFFALDLLSEKPTLNVISEKWGAYLPVWIPFALWTKVISVGSPADCSIKNLLEHWFKGWDCEGLIPLVQNALKDKRLLLLIDGLDEYSSEDSAKIALNHLESFLSENDVVVIATTRPHGFERLGMRLDGWQQAQIANFSSKQQEELVKIWFNANSVKINPGLNPQQRGKDVQRQTYTFFAELKRSNELLELSKNPLLLCLLIYFQISSIRLPIRRFEAYGVLTDYLISTHPQVRRVAADTAQQQELNESYVKKTLAYFAYILHLEYSEGLLEEDKSLQVLVDFLKDDNQGFGMDQAKAMQTARSILNQAESNLGIIVRRSHNEIGFYHRTIQEYLAALNLSRLPLEEQSQVIEKHCTDPVWREVILGLFQITKRPKDIKRLVGVIKGKDIIPSEKKIVEDLLSEIAFGYFNCPPNLARELAQQAFNEIELGTWLPHREKILKHALDGLRSPVLAELVKEKVTSWFPDRVGFRCPYIFEAMVKWPTGPDLLDGLFKGLNSEDYRVKAAAVATLAKVFNNNIKIGNRLVALANQTDNPYVSAAATEAVILGWPEHKQLLPILKRFVQSSMPTLQLVGIKGKVALGLQTDADLRKILRLANWESGLYLSGGGIAKTIVKGWPQSKEVKKICMRSYDKWGHGKFDIEREIALHVLLEGYPMDEDVVSFCIRILENEKSPFLIGSMDAFRLLADNFKDHPRLIQALDKWVQGVEHRDVEASYAALVGRTETFKSRLIQDLRKSFPHWPARALLKGWSMQDLQVSAALQDAVSGPASRASSFAHLMPEIITNKKECRKKLLQLLKDPDCRRYDFVITGLIKLGSTEGDTEVVDVALSILEKVDNNYIDGLKAGLIKSYSFDSRVRNLAIKALDERDEVYEVVAYTFGEDPKIRKQILDIVNPLPVTLRQVIATYLSETEVDEMFAISILNLYDHETDEQVKVQASIGFHSRLKASNSDPTSALERLSKTIVCYGSDYVERRLAAFCGLVTLDRLDIMVGGRERIGDPDRKVAIQSIQGFRLNVPHVRFILKNWDNLKEYLKDEFWKRLFRYDSGSSYIWNHLSQFADEYDTPRKEVLRYLSTRNPKVAPSELLRFLSRTMPGSNLLLEYCLNTLGLKRVETQGNNINLTYIDKVTAANLIGDHFGGNIDILQRINTKQNRCLLNEMVLVLSEGWPTSIELNQLFNSLVRNRRRCWESTAVRYHCLKSGPITVYKQLLRLLRRWSSQRRSARADVVLRPLVRRLQKDNRLLKILIKHLNGYPRSAEKVSITKLVHRAKGLIPELKDWAQKELTNQLSEHGIESGFDITTNNFVSVPHALYEILIGDA